MSLLDDLAVRLTDASDGLPVPELRRAVGAISRAADRLRYVAATESLARLGLATAHLESSVSLLLRAQDEVAAYLATIGATVPAVSPGFVPVSAVAAGDCDGGPLPPEDERWWARRIGELTGERAAAERGGGGRGPGGRGGGGAP